MLQTASPDAIVRLACTVLADEKDAINRIYSEEQHHKSIVGFLSHFLHDSDMEGGLLLQVTCCLFMRGGGFLSFSRILSGGSGGMRFVGDLYM